MNNKRKIAIIIAIAIAILLGGIITYITINSREDKKIEAKKGKKEDSGFSKDELTFVLGIKEFLEKEKPSITPEEGLQAPNSDVTTPTATDTPMPIATDAPTPVATDTPTPVAADTPTPKPTNTFTPIPQQKKLNISEVKKHFEEGSVLYGENDIMWSTVSPEGYGDFFFTFDGTKMLISGAYQMDIVKDTFDFVLCNDKGCVSLAPSVESKIHFHDCSGGSVDKNITLSFGWAESFSSMTTTWCCLEMCLSLKDFKVIDEWTEEESSMNGNYYSFAGEYEWTYNPTGEKQEPYKFDLSVFAR